MEAPTGYKPASELPQTLLSCLEVLLRENGAPKSWQMFGEKVGVTVKLRFGPVQNGGHSPIVASGTKVSYAKKSPCQQKRDDRKAAERRITRSSMKQRGAEDGEDIEMARGESAAMVSPLPIQPCSPVTCVPVSSSTPEQSNLLSHMSDLSVPQQPAYQSVDPDQSHATKASNVNTESADHEVQCPSSDEGLTRTTADAETDSDGTESEEDDIGANLSKDFMDYYKYCGPKPTMRKCSYCGIIKGRFGKIIMQCDYPECGRKLCQKCIQTEHHRHKKHLSECVTGYLE